MIDKQTLLSLRGQELTDRNGDKIGKVEEIYLDQETDKPEWALVKRGMFGSGFDVRPARRRHRRGGPAPGRLRQGSG